MAAPLTYYLTNTCKTRSLLQSCVDQGITRFVFSSTAAVYGEPDEVPVGEAAPTRPASPYGASKLMVEWMLRDVDRAHGLRHVILSYFNVAGADPLGRRSEEPPSELQSLLRISYAVFCLKKKHTQIRRKNT